MKTSEKLVDKTSNRKRTVPVAVKLALVFTALITIGMLTLGIIVGRDQTKLITKQTVEFGTTLSIQMADSAVEPLLANDQLALELIVNNLASQERIVGAALFGETLGAIAQTGAVPNMVYLRNTDETSQMLEWRYQDRENGNRVVDVMSFITPVKLRDVKAGFALITLDRAFLDQAKHRTIQTVAGTTVLLVLLGIAVSIVLAERITRPIYELMNVSTAIARGNYNYRFNGERNDEIGDVTDALHRMADGLVRKEHVEKAFSRYVSPKIAQKIMDDLQDTTLGGTHVEASVLFADIVGFTSLTESMPAEEVSALLNEYFTHITQAAEVYQGHIDKFIGDCVMIVFGVPDEDSEHEFHAIACAVLIKKVIDVLNHLRARRGLPTVKFKVGIGSGPMIAGNMGSADRMEYTVVGDPVNLASRLSSAAGAGEIIISKYLFQRMKNDNNVVFKQHETLFLRGKKAPVESYKVLDLEEPYRTANNHAVHQIFKSRVRAV